MISLDDIKDKTELALSEEVLGPDLFRHVSRLLNAKISDLRLRNCKLSGPFTVKSPLRLQHGDNQDHAATIAVEPDKQSDHPLIFKTFSFGKSPIGWPSIRMVMWLSAKIFPISCMLRHSFGLTIPTMNSQKMTSGGQNF